MRKILLVIFCCTLTAAAWAQGANKRVYKSPNEFQNISGVLNLKSGKKLEGFVSVNFNNLHEEVVFRPEEGREKAYPAEDVVSYESGDKVYVLKELDTTGTGLKYINRFCLRLSETFNKLAIYQYDYQSAELKNPPASPAPNTTRMYFVQVPSISHKKILWVYGASLVPDFDTKMAIALKDLLPLSTHIAMKDKGYYYDAAAPANVVLKVWKTIVEEYNASN